MSEYNIQMNKYNALNAQYDQLYPATKIENVDGLDTALQNKAPAGYGLGSISKFISSSDDLNDVVYDGWYCFDAAPINAPLLDGVNAVGYSSMLVSNRDPSLYVTQEIFCYASWEAFNCVLRRCRINGEWKPWEWVNPPMMLNTEYRTTERYQGKPVYTKACGPVHGTATASTVLTLVNQFNIQYSVQETIVECKCLIGTYSDGKLVNAVDNVTFYNSDSLYIRRTGMDKSYVRLEFLGYSGDIGFIAKIKYTKSTD